MLDAELLNNLKDYKGISKLKKAALNILIRNLESTELEHLRQ